MAAGYGMTRSHIRGTLPFGLRSAPLLFTALGDALEWVAKAHGTGWLRHYIDDFVTVGAPGKGGSSCVVVCRVCLVYNLTKFWL